MRFGIVVGIAGALLLAAPLAGAAERFTGKGAMTDLGCSTGSTSVALSGVETAPWTWHWELVLANTDAANPACPTGAALSFQGTWDAAAGGCLLDLLGTTTLCLEKPVSEGALRGYDVRACNASGCFSQGHVAVLVVSA